MSLGPAFAALNTTFSQYFASVPSADQSVELQLLANKTSATGIGAYVGSHMDPSGDITAIRVDTTAAVKIEASAAELTPLVQSVTTAVMAIPRGELQSAGIYRLALRDLEAVREENNNRASQIINFSLLYEHLTLPSESESQIDEIILDIDLNSGERHAEVLVNTGFDNAWATAFDVVDDPDAAQNPPSNWVWDEVQTALHQTSAIQGGSLAMTARKSGTYLLFKPETAIPVTDFLIDVDFTSHDNDGVGFVFRYQDIDNFYFCLLSARNDYAMLGKKVGAVFSFLDQGGQAEITPYQVATLHRLKLIARGNQFQVQVDDNPLVQGEDSSFTDSGRVGLMCHGNNDIFFHRVQLLKLNR